MAKLIYDAGTSLDGYVADEAGNFEWAELGGDVQAYINSRESRVGDPTQRLGDVRRALPAVVPVLGQAGTHQAIERRRCQRLSGHDRLRLVLQDGADEAGLARRCEGALSRCHLVQHQRQGPDVGADVRFLPLDLLGGHVRQRTEQGALTRQRLLGRGGKRRSVSHPSPQVVKQETPVARRPGPDGGVQ